MRARTWAVGTALALALTACTSDAVPEGGTESPAEVGWPDAGMPGFYMVSEEIQEFCPNGEEYLGGTQITDVILATDFDGLDGYACVFAAPASGDPDEVDEFAYRVVEGLTDLVQAYSETTYAFEGECAEPIPPSTFYPHVRVEYGGVGYTLTVAGCGSSDALDEAVDDLRLIEVARDTVGFAEYQESGL